MKDPEIVLYFWKNEHVLQLQYSLSVQDFNLWWSLISISLLQPLVNGSDKFWWNHMESESASLVSC